MKITIYFIIIAAVLIYLLRWVFMYFTKKVVDKDGPKPEEEGKEEPKQTEEGKEEEKTE